MSTFVTHMLNSPQMHCCYIIELVLKVLSFRGNVWMDDVWVFVMPLGVVER